MREKGKQTKNIYMREQRHFSLTISQPIIYSGNFSNKVFIPNGHILKLEQYRED